MTHMKPIAGHGSARRIRYRLFKSDRALALDFLNITDRDWHGNDWAKVMDKTREVFGNDKPAKEGDNVRTYEHVIVSLDPKDDWVELDDFRDFIIEWAEKWFDSRGPEGEGIGRFEVAIVYHDDNAAREAAGKQGILHAHLVINNTDLETGRRISGLLTTEVARVARLRNEPAILYAGRDGCPRPAGVAGKAAQPPHGGARATGAGWTMTSVPQRGYAAPRVSASLRFNTETG